MKIIKLNKNALKIGLDIIKKGGLVVCPSDTVYGLLADATNESAVKKLILFKNRPPGKPISVFVPDFNRLQKQVKVEKTQLKTLHQFLPGPFTVILSSKHRVSPLLESEKGTLGVRIPDYNFIRVLTDKFGKPISATSANLSGKPAHYSVRTLLNVIPESKKQLIDLIIDAGKLPRNKPSTVIDLTRPELKIIRKGEIVFRDREVFLSESATQTKKIAQFILKKILQLKFEPGKKTLIFIIEGDLGVGKTVFVKGIADLIGIDNIVSPTFVVYYEYPVVTKRVRVLFNKKLVHIDLYNIQDPEEFQYLGIEKYLDTGNLLCFEWGEKAGEIINKLRQKGKVVYISMKYIDEKRREIRVNF